MLNSVCIWYIVDQALVERSWYIIMFVSEEGGSSTDIVIQGALERREELLFTAHQEASKLKRRLLETAKAQIDQEFAEKLRKQEAQKRINRSALINSHRMRRIKLKNELCQHIFGEVEARLERFASQEETRGQYACFLMGSVVEGLVRMFEEEVQLRCLKRDQKLVQSLLAECRQMYADFMRSQVGFEYPLQLSASSVNKLEQRRVGQIALAKGLESSQAIGGIILADRTGNILYKATLDCRLNILRQSSLPLVRSMTWPSDSSK